MKRLWDDHDIMVVEHQRLAVAVNERSSLVDSLWGAWLRDVQVHAFKAVDPVERDEDPPRYDMDRQEVMTRLTI